MKILTIAKNTFREAVRDRILYNLVLFVLLITAAAIFLGEITDGQEVRTTINLGLNAMLIFGAFIAIFVGVGLVSKEIEKRTVYAIFAKPVKRSEFILGKYFGLVLTLGFNLIIMGIGVSLAVLYVDGGMMAATIWATIFFIFLELAILTAVAITFSSFSSPALSALFAFMIFVAGNFSASLRDLANALGSASAQYFFGAVYYILPNFSLYGFQTQSAYGLMPSTAMLGYAIVYAIIYIAILLVITSFIFSRRNFK